MFGFGSHGKVPPHSSRPADLVFKPKVVMLGGNAAGKTALLLRWVYDSFRLTCATVFITYYDVSRIIDGDDVTVRIGDTPGQVLYTSITRAYLRDASGIFLVFDVTRKDTFGFLLSWLAVVREDCPSDAIVMVIGNTIDLEDRREVTESEGAAFARENSLLYFETSAKTGDGVEAPLLAMMSDVTYMHKCRWILGSGDQN
jgi:small GTP-binding protein